MKIAGATLEKIKKDIPVHQSINIRFISDISSPEIPAWLDLYKMRRRNQETQISIST